MDSDPARLFASMAAQAHGFDDRRLDTHACRSGNQALDIHVF